MYGGLFGKDLPPTRKDVDKPNKDEKKQGKSSIILPPLPPQPEATGKPSVVDRLGTSGTAMAFVPTAAVRRRNNLKRQHPPRASNLSKKPSTDSSMGTSKVAVKVESPSPPGGTEVVSRGPEKVTIQSESESSLPRENTITRQQNEVKAPSSPSPEILRNASVQRQVEQDPYDPLIPNDLLEYWERQAAQKVWEEQQRERARIEEERKRLAPVERVGRGRGKVSNLPAWMEQRLREEQKNL